MVLRKFCFFPENLTLGTRWHPPASSPRDPPRHGPPRRSLATPPHGRVRPGPSPRPRPMVVGAVGGGAGRGRPPVPRHRPRPPGPPRRRVGPEGRSLTLNPNACLGNCTVIIELPLYFPFVTSSGLYFLFPTRLPTLNVNAREGHLPHRLPDPAPAPPPPRRPPAPPQAVGEQPSGDRPTGRHGEDLSAPGWVKRRGGDLSGGVDQAARRGPVGPNGPPRGAPPRPSGRLTTDPEVTDPESRPPALG